MIKVQAKSFILTGFVLTVLFCAQPLYSEIPLPPGMDDIDEDVVYQFNRHLSNAETWVVDSKQDYIKGKWTGDGYEFEGLGPRSKIQPIIEEVDGSKRKGIRFNPIKGARRYLQFFNVKPGSRLFLAYGLDADPKAAKVSYLDFKIKVGKKTIHKLRTPFQQGWFTEEISLGIPGFLGRKVTVTFEVFTNSSERAFLTLHAEILT